MTNERYDIALTESQEIQQYLGGVDNFFLPINYIDRCRAALADTQFNRDFRERYGIGMLFSHNVWQYRDRGMVWAGQIEIDNKARKVVIVPAQMDSRLDIASRRLERSSQKEYDICLIDRNKVVYRVGNVKEEDSFIDLLLGKAPRSKISIGKENIMTERSRVRAGGFSYLRLSSQGLIDLVCINRIDRDNSRNSELEDQNYQQWLEAIILANRLFKSSCKKLYRVAKDKDDELMRNGITFR